MGPFAPFLATIQALSRTRVFSLSEIEQKLLCMGRTFTANKTLPLYLGPKQLSVSWESDPARVKASKRDYYLVYILKIFNFGMVE
jgi:hypothetical protein